jgi:hypothetical protein
MKKKKIAVGLVEPKDLPSHAAKQIPMAVV